MFSLLERAGRFAPTRCPFALIAPLKISYDADARWWLVDARPIPFEKEMTPWRSPCR
jgi:hypothetical protein